MDIVYYPIEYKYYSIPEIHRPLYISQVLCLSFVNIKSGIMEYRPNELHASQWLKMMIEYAHQDRTNILKVKDTLTELIDNNEKILTTCIKQETFQQFTGYLFEAVVDEKSVKILRAMCVCNNKPILNNQETITSLLLTDKT